MNEDDPEEPAEDDGFFLMEGWMFGALMYPGVVQRLHPAANDNARDG